MFYNTENLFDTSDDSLTDDSEFLPGGPKGWSLSRYKRKTEGLYKTIMAAGEWDPPVIVALCEVENRGVLKALVSGTGLSKYAYSIIHEESPDRRGIDVCMIYRPDRVKLVDTHYWIPPGIAWQDFTSRSVLYTSFAIGDDTIHIIVNHWPSRRGGVLAAGNMRHMIAAMVKYKADSLCIKHPKARIIIAGDFNSNPGDPEIAILTERENGRCRIINLSDNNQGGNTGTYKYRGTWEMIDQVLVSESLIDSGYGLYADTGSFKIYNPPFLLAPDEKYSGQKPYSTYSGYIYNGGFSDHLPVLLDLKLREVK